MMEQAATWWQILITILGACGGLEAIKWFANRKTNFRIAIAEAESAEFQHLKETNEWLQKQLHAKEERFAEQTQLVRKQNLEILDLTTQVARKEVEHVKAIAALEIELASVRCNDEECPFRLPPTAKTKPRPGLTKEQYHQNKSTEQ